MVIPQPQQGHPARKGTTTMGNVAKTPRLLDVPIGPSGPGSFVIDKVTTAAAWDGKAKTDPYGKVLAPAPNVLGVVIDGATISATADVALGRWTEISVSIPAGISQTAAERVNKVLRDLGAPTLGTNWRTKHLQLNVAKGVVKTLPVAYRGINPAGGAWVWSVAGIGLASPAPAKVRTARPKVGTAAATKSAPVVAPKVEAPVEAPVVVTPAPTATLAPKGDPGIFTHPKPFPFDVYQTDRVKNGLERALKLHRKMRARRTSVVLLNGPTGTGKTLSAEDLAARHGLPYLKVDAAGMVTFADWVGATGLADGPTGVVTRFEPSQFLEAIRADGPYAGQLRIVLVDEVNRVAGTSAMNALLPITDGTGTLYVPDAKRTFHVDRAVLFVFTANVGSQYGGTVEMDPAMINRVGRHLPVDYPPANVEAKLVAQQSGCSLVQAEYLVRVATQVRLLSANRTIDAPGVSTRQLIAAGEDVSVGAPLLDAALDAFVDAYKTEGGAQSERAHVLAATEAILRGVQGV